MYMRDESLRKSRLNDMVPHLPMRPRHEDDSACKLLNATLPKLPPLESLKSPAQQSPPSSTESSRSSSRRGSFSSRLSTPSTSASTASSNAGSRNSSRRKSSVGGLSLTAHAASHDLRRFSQARNRKYSDESEAFHSSPALTMDELMLDLKGGNGRRRKQEAEEELERRNWLQAEKNRQVQREEVSRRQVQKEKEDWLRRTLEDQQEIMRTQAEHERREEEREEKKREMEEHARLALEAKEALRKHLQQGTPCLECASSGKCSGCSGSGCISVTYLSSAVSDTSSLFSGRTHTGCRACGGRQDGAEVLKLDVPNFKGHGKCVGCKGLGATYLSKEQVEIAMRRQQHATR